MAKSKSNNNKQKKENPKYKVIPRVKKPGEKGPTHLPPMETRWVKGIAPNPAGRPKDPPEMRRLKNLTKQELVDVGNIIVKGNMDDLKNIKGDPEASVLKTMIAAIAARVIRQGDMHALNVLLDRLIGKVKDEVRNEHHISNLPMVTVTLPSNGREAKDV